MVNLLMALVPCVFLLSSAVCAEVFQRARGRHAR